MAKIKITGIDELQKKLKDNATLEDVKEVVKMNGAEMHEKAQRYAPVDEGYLKREIGLDIVDSGMASEVEGNADYDPYQEYGTRFMEGTPHIRPAYNEQKEQFKSDMDRLVR